MLSLRCAATAPLMHGLQCGLLHCRREWQHPSGTQGGHHQRDGGWADSPRLSERVRLHAHACDAPGLPCACMQCLWHCLAAVSSMRSLQLAVSGASCVECMRWSSLRQRHRQMHGAISMHAVHALLPLRHAFHAHQGLLCCRLKAFNERELRL
jgi:hypothetical protein